MTPGFDDFLSDLRGQLARCAAAPSETTPRRSAHRQVSLLRLREPRVAFAWAATLLLGLAAVVGVVLVARPGGGVSASSVVHGAHPSGSFAYVLPLPTVAPTPAMSPSASAAASSEPDYLLEAVAARSSTDAWAVGRRVLGDTGGRERTTGDTLILHWDGAMWRQTEAPEVGGLKAVTVASSGRAWALGDAGATVLQWDGRDWTIVPDFAPDDSILNGISAVGSNDVWVVGGVGVSGVSSRPLTMHWDGTAWKEFAVPAEHGVVSGPGLTAVAGSSSTDVWAVGGCGPPLHWDGTRWAFAKVESDDRQAAALGSVVAAGPADAWAAGFRCLQRWDGTAWKDVPHEFGAVQLTAATSPGDVWGVDHGVVHWDGESWTVTSAGEMGLAAGADIRAVASASASDVWVVGTIAKAGESTERPLIVHWDGSGWRLVVDAAQAYGEE